MDKNFIKNERRKEWVDLDALTCSLIKSSRNFLDFDSP